VSRIIQRRLARWSACFLSVAATSCGPAFDLPETCPLGGSWEVTLQRFEPAAPTAVSGTIRLGEAPPRPNILVVEPTFDGRYDFDFTPLLVGAPGFYSTSTGAGTADEIEWGVRAWLHPGDTVDIALSPLVSHGPISLRGVVASDSIFGEWYQRSDQIASEVPYGMFLARRVTPCFPS
jgi:hypothetical protein